MASRNGHAGPNVRPAGNTNPQPGREVQIDPDRLVELERQLAEAERRIEESRAKLDRLLAKRGVST